MTVLPSDSRLWHKNFLFGTATAAFQIEGANTEDGRVASIWDHFCAQPGRVKNGDDGSQACDHYHRWQSDLDLIADLGVDAYRFSIAWPRIFGNANQRIPNTKGMDFYKRLLDQLQASGIKAFVTLYHWDLPEFLGARGGWLNRDTAYRFADYVDTVTRALGDQVYSWATLNEPWCSAMLSYQLGVHAPGYTNLKYARQAAHHLLLAHGLGMQILNTNAPKAENGIVLNLSPAHAVSAQPEHQKAARWAFEDNHRWFLEPLFKGCYPFESFTRHPFAEPLILPGDLDVIATPVDYLGINYYTRDRIMAADNDMGYESVGCPDSVESTAMGWEIYPQGLTEILTQIHNDYKLPPIYITENGMAEDDHLAHNQVHDPRRVRYLQDHWLALDHAIRAGVDVRGWFAWSLMDNFEWAEGYDKRFGIYYVDYHSQQRIPKDSAKMYQAFLQQRKHKQ